MLRAAGPYPTQFRRQSLTPTRSACGPYRHVYRPSQKAIAMKAVITAAAAMRDDGASMRSSPSWRAVSQTGHIVLSHLEGDAAENGYLSVEGSARVDAAIREVIALGFVEATESGYRLTYRRARGRPASNEWRRIVDVGRARAVAYRARNEVGADPTTYRPGAPLRVLSH